MFLLIFLVLINLIVVFSSLVIASLFGVSERHYFLGTGRSIFTLHIRRVKFSVAKWLPLAINFRSFGSLPVTRVQAIVDGKQQRSRQAWEFSDKSIVRRAFVILAPTLLLLVIGVLYSIGVAFTDKESYLSKATVNARGIYPSPWGRHLGFERGDKIIAVNGRDFEKFEEAIVECTFKGGSLTVLRNGTKHDIEIKGTLEELMFGGFGNFIDVDVPFDVEYARIGSPAALAGIEPGDRIIRVDSTSVFNFVQVSELLTSDEDGVVDIGIERITDGKKETFTRHIVLDEDRSLGISPRKDYDFTIIRPTVSEAITNGFSYAFSQVRSTIRIFRRQITRQVSKGPIGISSTSEPWKTAGPFAVFFAVLSLTPIPGTRFWSLMALLSEVVNGKTPNYQSVANSQKYGLYLLMILAAIVVVSEIFPFGEI